VDAPRLCVSARDGAVSARTIPIPRPFASGFREFSGCVEAGVMAEGSPFWAAHVHADRRAFLLGRGRIKAALCEWFAGDQAECPLCGEKEAPVFCGE